MPSNTAIVHAQIQIVKRTRDKTKLDLSFSGLTSIPPEVFKLTKLTSLDLSNNQITSLSPEIKNLTNLTELRLGNNLLKTLPKMMFEWMQGSEKHLKMLDLSNNQLTSEAMMALLPDPLKFDWMLWNPRNQYNRMRRRVYRSWNRSSYEKPKSIHLDLRNNCIDHFPVELLGFYPLSPLKLSYNPIQNLPSSVVDLDDSHQEVEHQWDLIEGSFTQDMAQKHAEALSAKENARKERILENKKRRIIRQSKNGDHAAVGINMHKWQDRKNINRKKSCSRKGGKSKRFDF